MEILLINEDNPPGSKSKAALISLANNESFLTPQ